MRTAAAGACAGAIRRTVASMKPDPMVTEADPTSVLEPERIRRLPVTEPVMIRRSPVIETALAVAIAAAKTATIACALYALRHADTPRLRGKGIRTRAVGYAGGLLLVPAIWTLLPNRGRYPRALDLAVTIPLLLDAGGNALGKYQEAHVDDLVHIANAAIVSGVVGALAAPNVDERWQAAGIGAGVAVAGATVWELAEYGALQLGADGMDLTYEDTMADLAEGLLGAALGALFTLTRVPRSRSERNRRGWREPLGLRDRKIV
jgi:hypothetical protein